MPQHDDDDDQPTSYIGRTVRKYFPGHGFFRGTVAEEEEEGLFRVIYEDKDEEDMLVEELEQVLIKDDGELSSRAVLTVSTNGATQQSSPSLLIRRLVDALSDEQVAGITRRRWPLFRVATVCSGTDAPIMALEMIQSALSQRDVDVLEIDHLFSCENVPFKRDFIMKTSNPPVVFKDVVELHTGQGECHDGVVRPVPRDITILVAGTECVDFSSLSTTRKGLTGKGRSAVTFWATLDLVKATNPPLVLLENVAKCPAEEMEKAFKNAGYSGAHTKVCTSDYLLPQRRQRTYFLFWDPTRIIMTKNQWIDTMQRLGPERPSLPNETKLEWTDFLRSNSTAVSDGPERRGARRGKSLAESTDAKWLKEVETIEESEKLVPHTERGGRPYTDACIADGALDHFPDRAKMRLDVQAKRALKVGIDPFKTPLIWNPAQQLRFTEPGFDAAGVPLQVAPCVTPKHEWIVSTRKGPLTGRESLSLQGIALSDEQAAHFNCQQLRDLGGNAMSTTVVASAILAAFVSFEVIENKKRDSMDGDVAHNERKRSRLDKIQ